MASGFKFSTRSLKAMAGVHPDLVKVAYRALELSTIDFIVTEGLRSEERQRYYISIGASRTMKSNHLTGRALDTVAWTGGHVSYGEKDMKQIAAAFKAASKELGIPVDWGGDWKSFQDTPHFELRKGYKDA